MMKILSRILSRILLGLFLIGLIPVAGLRAQDESFRIKLESILYRFVNYRFSNISVYEMKDIKDIRKALDRKSVV